MTAACPEVHDEIVDGLTNPQASISPKYFYDRTGSALFEEITRLPEYYPSHVERALLDHHGEDIARHLPDDAIVIEPGAGNCEKGGLLCRRVGARHFVPIDISADFLRQAANRLAAAHPGLTVQALGGDLTGPLTLPPDLPRGRRLLFYPGSSIGNFEPLPAQHLLHRLRNLLEGDGALLLGIDLIKEAAVMEAAYNDSAGVTAAFNRNILNHLNQLIGSNFRLSEWHHRAFYNAARGRIEMHLAADRDVIIRWPGGERHFAAGETIHTENSYKYTVERFSALLRAAGFHRLDWWSDPRRWYALFLARL